MLQAALIIISPQTIPDLAVEHEINACPAWHNRIGFLYILLKFSNYRLWREHMAWHNADDNVIEQQFVERLFPSLETTVAE